MDCVSGLCVRRLLTKLYSLPSHFPLILQVHVVARWKVYVCGVVVKMAVFMFKTNIDYSDVWLHCFILWHWSYYFGKCFIKDLCFLLGSVLGVFG